MSDLHHEGQLNYQILDIPNGIENTEIIKAAYALAEFFDVQINDEMRQCKLTRLDGQAITEENIFLFRRELYDYHLRRKLKDETSLERMLILSAAFDHIATPEE